MKSIRKYLVGLILLILIANCCQSQDRISLLQIDSLLQGTWKVDDSINTRFFKSNFMRFDFQPKDTNIVTVTTKKWSGKFTLINKDLLKCINYRSKIIGYSIREIVPPPQPHGDIVSGPMSDLYIIGTISSTHLILYWANECSFLSFTKENITKRGKIDVSTK